MCPLEVNFLNSARLKLLKIFEMKEQRSRFAFEVGNFGGNAGDVLEDVGVVQILEGLCRHKGKRDCYDVINKIEDKVTC